jgi:hypothetical protein
MSNRNPHLTTAAAMIAALLALAACDPAPKESPPTNSPSAPGSQEPVPGETPAGAPAPGEVPPPDESPAAPVQPPAEAPPPTEPSAAPKPTSSSPEPALESMLYASASTKLGVPVDLRYSFDTEPLTNQPVILHLAAVPRVAGTNLAVSLKDVSGIQVAAGGPLSVQKASASGAYRQQFSVTRQASAPGQLRVLVTMDLPEGSGFGFYNIPFEPGKLSQKQDSVKQR